MQLNLTEIGKQKRIFWLKCKWCGGKQKMIIYRNDPTGHSRRCVYCNKVFIIHKENGESCIIKEI